MAGLIPQRFIDDLLSRADILDVVDSRVKLRKTGKNYSGLCPFHQEKSPSFSVQPEKQFYYCFGCGAGGNALGFIMNYDNLSFPEAVESLAKDMGVEVPREESSKNKAETSRYEAMLRLLSEVNKWYQLQLRRHPSQKKAVDYLKARGLSGEVARDYCIGYAPPGWDNLLNEFGEDDKRKTLLLDTGMLIANEDNTRRPYYDRFRDRIMYPIRDPRGRVLGFGGRVLGNDKPKYLNSPETPVFRKGEELYGLYEARRKLKNPPRYVIVEGYMDVIALAQHGIHYCVATLGTATSAAHLRTLFKQAPEVVFCFDGDNAGREAAWRALQAALPLLEDGRSARFLFLPEGQDPDTQVRKIGHEAFEASLANATRLADFFYDTLSARLDMDAFEGKAQLGKLAIPLLQKLPKGIFRELMLDQLSQLTGVAAEKFMTSEPEPANAAPSPRQSTTAASNNAPAPPGYDVAMGADYPPDIGQNFPSNFSANSGSNPYTPRVDQHSRVRGTQRIRVELSPCMKAVNLLISKPDIISDISIAEELQHMNTNDKDLLLKVVELARLQPEGSTMELMSRIYATSFGSQLTQLLGREQITPPEGIASEFQEILDRLVHQHRKAQQTAKLLETLHRQHAQRDNSADDGQPVDN